LRSIIAIPASGRAMNQLMSVIERYFASAVSVAKKRDFGQLANFNAEVDN
jgi:hypothetical protein